MAANTQILVAKPIMVFFACRSGVCASLPSDGNTRVVSKKRFHSTAFVHTVAYACLNDWDGLILYNYNTSEHPEDEPADGILTIFDSYNDPALIAQWGFMATMFLKGLVSPAKNRVDVVYTQNDWKTLPNFHAMPMCTMPYLTAFRNVFLDGGERYEGDADVAINAGFLNGGDLRDAKHGVYYAWSPYRDAKRKYLNETRLKDAVKNTEEIQAGVQLGSPNTAPTGSLPP